MTIFTPSLRLFLLSLLPPCLAAATTANQQQHQEQEQEHDLVHRRAIIGGAIADPSRYPYYVRLDYEGVFGCGGSLITKEFVLTAAHCAFQSDVSTMSAVVGGYNLTSTSVGVSRAVLNTYLHVAYDDLISVSNDVALLKIEPIPDDLNITMLQYRSRRDFLQAGDSVTVIGLGATETEDAADQLKEVELKIVNDTTCDEQYSGAIHRKSMLCAADPGEDACQGDSGGPLIVLGATAADDVQVGVVSWGEQCGTADKPGVYADVAYLESWIDSMICKHSENPPEGCEITLETETGPFILNADTDVCRDFSGAFYAGWWHQFRRCDWLRDGGRINWYCNEDNEAWANCPLTCHMCTYEADDDGFVGMDDEWASNTNYDESSNPTARLASIFLSFMLIVFFMVYMGWCRCCCCKCCNPASRQRATRGEVGTDEEVVDTEEAPPTASGSTPVTTTRPPVVMY